MQRKHHFQKILVPAKTKSNFVKFKHKNKPNNINCGREKTIHCDNFNTGNALKLHEHLTMLIYFIPEVVFKKLFSLFSFKIKTILN